MKASKIVLCFENHHADGKVWAIRVGRKWTRHAQVVCYVPLVTVYNGPKARQPRAYMTGEGRVIIGEHIATIVP